ATDRATAMLESHLAWAAEPAGRETLAGLLALDVATDPASADRLDESTVARVKRAGELADGMGHRVVTRVVDALVAGVDDEFRRALITDAVARLAPAGEMQERRRSELE